MDTISRADRSDAAALLALQKLAYESEACLYERLGYRRFAPGNYPSGSNWCTWRSGDRSAAVAVARRDGAPAGGQQHG